MAQIIRWLFRMKRSLSMGREDNSSMEMIMIMNMLPATTSIFSIFLSHSLFGFMGISLEGLNRIMLILLLFGVVTWKRGECFVASFDLTFGDICNPATLLLFSGVKNRKWKLCSSERFFGGCCSLWRHSFVSTKPRFLTGIAGWFKLLVVLVFK